jgi:hypothetical protein
VDHVLLFLNTHDFQGVLAAATNKNILNGSMGKKIKSGNKESDTASISFDS